MATKPQRLVQKLDEILTSSVRTMGKTLLMRHEAAADATTLPWIRDSTIDPLALTQGAASIRMSWRTNV
jgi:hypothetical protein